MTIHKGGNYSLRDPENDDPCPFQDGDTIERGNFFQHTPDTPIMAGIENLIITGGNWTNVRKQPTWSTPGGNWTQVSLCAHIRPELVPFGLPAEVENCSHVVDIDTVHIDGQLVDTIYHREDTKV